MLELCNTLIGSNSVIPYGYDDWRKPDLIWLQTLSGAVTALAGYSVALLLISVGRQQQASPFAKIFILFGVFLTTFSTIQVVQWTFWQSIHWGVGLIQAFAAGILAYVTWELFRLLPAVTLSTRDDLKATQDAILNAIPDLMVRLSRDGAYLDILESKAIKPYKPTFELLGKRLEDVLPTEIAQTALQHVRQALATQEVQIYEYRLGYTHHVQDFEARIVACGSDDVLAIVRDVSDRKRSETERQQAEAALAQREARFRALVQHSSDMIVIVGVDGNRTYVSPSVKEILGYSPEDLIGQSAFNLVHPEDIPATQAAFYTALQQPEAPVKVEIRFCRVDGSWANLECVGSNQLNEPSIAGVVVNCRDVSDRTQAEQEIRQLNERLEQQNRDLESLVEQRTAELLTFINALPDYIFVIDRDMRVQFCNDALAQAIGAQSCHEVEGKTIFECFLPDVAATFAEQNQVIFTSGEMLHFQEKYELATGIPYLDTFKIPLKHPNGEVYALIGTSRNISELVEVRQTLWQQTLQLEQANRELDSFSYSVSHDLRAPLRHISGFVSALREQLEQSEQGTDLRAIHYLDNIEDSSQRMSLLIDGLLALARVGRRKMERNRVNLRQLVNTAIALHQPEDNRPIEFQINDLPIVEGDATLLQQVLSNLISNAIKFSRDRQPAHIEVGCTSEGAIFVKDNGVGFQMEYADQLFGAFQRLHSQHEFEGTGIGLAIVQRIVSRHGGTIWAESQVNQGATFYFTLEQQGGRG